MPQLFRPSLVFISIVLGIVTLFGGIVVLEYGIDRPYLLATIISLALILIHYFMKAGVVVFALVGNESIYMHLDRTIAKTYKDWNKEREENS